MTTPFTFRVIGMDPSQGIIRDPTTLKRISGGSNMIVYSGRLFLLSILLFWCLPDWRRLAGGLSRFVPFLPFVVWTALSLTWTDSLSTSAIGFVVLMMIILTIYVIAIRLQPEQVANVFLWGAVLIAICTFLWVFLVPSEGVHQYSDSSQSVHTGSWRGIYQHKNHLGQVVAIFGTGLLFAGRAVFPRQWVRYATIAAFCVICMMSNSASSIFVLITAPVLTLAYFKLRSVYRYLALIIAIPMIFILMIIAGQLLVLLGRDPSLTGRTDIWALAIDHIAREPVTGYGFVSPTFGTFTYDLIQMMGVFGAHNGYLDMALGTGLVGLATFLLIVAAAGNSARRLHEGSESERQAAMVIGGIMIAWLLANCSESNLRPAVTVGPIGWMALSALVFAQPRFRFLQVRSQTIASVPSDNGAISPDRA